MYSNPQDRNADNKGMGGGGPLAAATEGEKICGKSPPLTEVLTNEKQINSLR